jgi:hypothetical protein
VCVRDLMGHQDAKAGCFSTAACFRSFHGPLRKLFYSGLRIQRVICNHIHITLDPQEPVLNALL